MQPDPLRLARQWIVAAQQDLEAAETLHARMPNVACFHAQQASEKALKALLLLAAGDTVRSHLSDMLLGEATDLGIVIPDEIVSHAQALDKFYITPRYPDALGADITTAFKSDEATQAIARAQAVVEFCRTFVSGGTHKKS